MAAEPFARMVNLYTGNIIGNLDATQLGFLRKHLEQESETDTSFVFVPETAEWMREQGGAEVANLLQKELRDAKQLSVGIAPLPRNARGRAYGRLLALETQRPLPGYKVEALDHHMFSDRLLGWSYSDAQGRFEVLFGDAALGHRSGNAETAPDVKLRIVKNENIAAEVNEESHSFPGLGSATRVAEEVVERSGAPPVPQGTEQFESEMAIDEKSAPSELPPNHDAVAVASDQRNSETIIVEGDVGSVAGLETEWRDIFISREGKLFAPVLEGAVSICPQCGAMYERGNVTCGDCHIPLYQLT